MFQIFQGTWPALVTPTNIDNSVNVSVLCTLVDYLIDKGVHGFYVGGSTGDGLFMPVPQRKVLVETALTHIRERVPVIVHTGAISCDDAIELSQHARKHGAKSISSVIPPLYDNKESLYQYYCAMAESVPDTPFIAYLLNPTVNSIDLMRQLIKIPNIAGVKYTGSNMYELKQIIELGKGKWTIFSGMDEQSVYGCMMGATGLIGSTLNFMPGVYLHIDRYVREGEYAKAQELQIQANQVITSMIEVGFKGALRAVLTDLLGVDVGNPRLPGLPLTDEQRRTLKEQLAKTPFDTLAKL